MKKYTIQEIEAALDIVREAIPGITIPKINYGTAVGGAAAPQVGATNGATWGTNLSAIPDIVAALVTGVLGAWNVTNFNLRSGNSDASSAVLLDPTNSQIRLGATTGDYITLDGILQQIISSNYQAGTSGFKISPNLVEAENIFARGTLNGVTFANNIISSVGGQLMVSNSSSLAEDMTSADNSTLTIKDDTTFSEDDIIIMKGIASNGIQEEWLKITDVSNAPEYSVTRDIAGAFNSGEKPAWKAGTPVVKQGSLSQTSGNKYRSPILTGGSNVSDLSYFEDIALSTQDAKIKLTINTTEYDNLSVSCFYPEDEISTLSTFNNFPNFYLTESGNVTSFKRNLDAGNTYTGVYYVNIRENNISGAIIATSGNTTVSGTTYAIFDFSVSNQVLLVNGRTYCFEVVLVSGDSVTWLNTATIYGYELVPVTQYAQLAENIQTAIRTVTSLLETVEYIAGQFIITGVEPDYYINISTPSTGTDISGAGSIKYLDLANGTSTQGGYGSGGWLRLFGEGTNSPYYSVYQRLSGLYNDYQEVCRLGNLNGFLDYTDNDYGIALGDNTANLCYDVSNGFRLRGVSNTWFEVLASDTLRTSSDAAVSTNSTEVVKVKEILYNDVPGTVRVKFTVWEGGDNGYSATGYVYKNGVSTGILLTRTYNAHIEGSGYLDVEPGDLIQLYLKISNASSWAGAENFRIFYDKQVTPETNIVNL